MVVTHEVGGTTGLAGGRVRRAPVQNMGALAGHCLVPAPAAPRQTAAAQIASPEYVRIVYP